MNILIYAVANTQGGLTNYILQNVKYADKTKFSFGLLYSCDKLDFKEKMESESVKFHKTPRIRNLIKLMQELKRIRIENNYEIIHVNFSYNNFLLLFLARLVGFKKIILHSHSTELDTNSKSKRFMEKAIHTIGKILTPLLADKYLACSELAAKWMFPNNIIKNKKYIVAKNAINLEKFMFDENAKAEKRKELNISNDCFVVGHIGRFCYQKNNGFIIKIFNEIVALNKNSKLVLIGGYLKADESFFAEVKELVAKFGLEDRVVFLGKRDDVSQLIQTMDCFILPSRFEGLPIVGIEAQCAGLQSYLSDVITSEVGITSLAHFISLEKEPKFWAQEILKTKDQKRFSPVEEIRLAGYDIKQEIKNIEKIYRGLQ